MSAMIGDTKEKVRGCAGRSEKMKLELTGKWWLEVDKVTRQEWYYSGRNQMHSIATRIFLWRNLKGVSLRFWGAVLSASVLIVVELPLDVSLIMLLSFSTERGVRCVVLKMHGYSSTEFLSRTPGNYYLIGQQLVQAYCFGKPHGGSRDL